MGPPIGGDAARTYGGAVSRPCALYGVNERVIEDRHVGPR